MDIINISIICILLLMIIISLLSKRYYSNYNKIKKLKYNKSDVETFYAGIYSIRNTSSFKLSEITLKNNDNDRILFYNDGYIFAKVYSEYLPKERVGEITKLFEMAPKMYSLIENIYYTQKYDNQELKNIIEKITEE